MIDELQRYTKITSASTPIERVCVDLHQRLIQPLYDNALNKDRLANKVLLLEIAEQCYNNFQRVLEKTANVTGASQSSAN